MAGSVEEGENVILKRLVLCGTLASLGLLLVAPSASACVTSSWITTDPSSGGPGTKVTITGAGFEPGTVMFRWDKSSESGGEVLGEATVADDGRVTAEVTVPEASPGAHKVIAEHTSSSETVAHADAWTDFEVPGAAPAPGSEAGSSSGAEESPAASGQDRAGNQPQVIEPVTSPVSVTTEVAQPVSETATVASSRSSEAARAAGSRSYRPLPQLSQRLRAVDLVTDPAVFDSAAPADAAEPAAPKATDEWWSEMRWVAAAVAAMTAALFALSRGRRRAPEPEGVVIQLSSKPDVQETEEVA